MVWHRFPELDQTYYVSAGSSVTTTEGAFTTNYAATWDGSAGLSGWATMDGGLNAGYTRGIKVYSASRIYIFGSFNSIGTATTLAPGYNFNLAMWDGTKWNYVGTAGTTNNTIDDVVYDADNDIS